MAVDRAVIFSILDIKGFDDGDVVYHEPPTYNPSLVSINGKLGDGGQRIIGFFYVTGIPDATVEYAKHNITKGYGTITVPAAHILGSDGDVYTLREDPTSSWTPIKRRRFKIAKAALIAQVPGATALINNIYNPALSHPMPGGVWPSITWDNLGVCWWDKFAGALATKATVETEHS